MPPGEGRGDGDLGSLNLHIGYIETVNDGPKPYIRTCDGGKSVIPGELVEYKLEHYWLIKVPDDIKDEQIRMEDAGSTRNYPPYIKVARILRGGENISDGISPRPIGERTPKINPKPYDADSEKNEELENELNKELG